MTIASVLNDEAFYVNFCIAQPAGSLTSITLWNPPNSGVTMALVKSGLWSSAPTEFNLKRTATITGFGTLRGARNSKYFPGGNTPIKTSKTLVYTLESGTTPSANGFEVYARGMQPIQDEYPFAMGPGEGLVVIPDTSALMNWCWSATFVEQPLP